MIKGLAGIGIAVARWGDQVQLLPPMTELALNQAEEPEHVLYPHPR